MRNFFNLRGTNNQHHSALKRPKSNPLSKRFRALFEIKPVRHLFGYSLIAGSITFTFINPSTAFSQNTAPVQEIITLSPSTLKLSTTESIRYPLDSAPQINQFFNSWHSGVDLKGNLKDPVYPILKGKISEVKFQNYAYGNHVIIDHGQGLYSLYAHLNHIYAQPGQTVTIYQPIGQVGVTGHTTGPHLHLEIIDQDRRINPLSLLNLN